MKHLILAIWAAAPLMCGTAHAQNFTFENVNTGGETIGGLKRGNDIEYNGTYWSGQGVSTDASGQTISTTFKCVDMKQPPNDTLFERHGTCDAITESGNYSVAFGCFLLDDKKLGTGCMGSAYGKTGVFKGRSGIFSLQANGKQGIVKGTGRWFEAKGF